MMIYVIHFFPSNLLFKLKISIFIYLEPTILMKTKKKKGIPVGERNTDVIEILSVTPLFMGEDYRLHEGQHGDSS